MRGAPKKTTTDSIMAAALAQFAEKGTAGTSVEDIARAAKIAKGTFYLYFPSKDAVVEAAFAGDSLAFGAEFAAFGPKPRIASIASSMLSFFGSRRLYLSELRLAYRHKSGLGFVRKARGTLQPLMTGFFKPDPRFPSFDLDTYAELIAGTALDLCAAHLLEGRIPDAAEAETMLKDFLKRFFDCEE